MNEMPHPSLPGSHGGRDDRPARDHSVVADLVTRAKNGNSQAWNALVERYSPLIWSICRKYGIGGPAAEDVAQCVWLYLVKNLENLREPAALPGWLATTAERECGRVRRALSALPGNGQALKDMLDEQTAAVENNLLVAERHAALREAFANLPPADQQLIALLIADPPVPYVEISARLGIPVGSIGPNRRRCLDKMRRYPAIAALISVDAETA
jgi:RNA polymerase sigma factor (sigma-70 family)